MPARRGALFSNATLPYGRTPPVLTNYFELSVGGTLAVGAWVGRHPATAQTDNVLR